MKPVICITIFIMFIGNTLAFGQTKTQTENSELTKLQSVQPTDSIYYSCVPCCEPCSVFTTNKAGECPHCGMTLQKRKYKADANTKNEAIPTSNSTCKPPKEKKVKK